MEVAAPNECITSVGLVLLMPCGTPAASLAYLLNILHLLMWSMQVPVPTTISKSYTIHTDAIHPKELIKSIKKALNSDPSKQQHKKTYYPIPHAVPTPVPWPTPVPAPTPTPWPAPVSATNAFVLDQ